MSEKSKSCSCTMPKLMFSQDARALYCVGCGLPAPRSGEAPTDAPSKEALSLGPSETVKPSKPEKRPGVWMRIRGGACVASAFAVTAAAALIGGVSLEHYDLQMYVFLGVLYVAALETGWKLSRKVDGHA